MTTRSNPAELSDADLDYQIECAFNHDDPWLEALEAEWTTRHEGDSVRATAIEAGFDRRNGIGG